MENDDEQAQKARADNLTDEIERLTSSSPLKKKTPEDAKAEDDTGPGRPPSPREFIQKRMRELDKGQKRKQTP